MIKIKSHFPDSKIVDNAIVLHKTVQNKGQIPINIPIDVIDHRFQEIVVSLEIEKGNKSTLTLVSLNLTNGFSWPDAHINSDNEFSVSTQQFLGQAAEELSGKFLSKQNLTYLFQVDADPAFDKNHQFNVKIKIDLHPTSLITTDLFGVLTSLPKELIEYNYRKESKTVLALLGWGYLNHQENASDWLFKRDLNFELISKFLNMFFS